MAIDPGVRTFQTWYRADGSWGKNGDEARQYPLAINKKISQLQSQLSQLPKWKDATPENKKQIETLEIKKRKLYLKKKNWMTHQHYAFCKQLTSISNTLILLPDFKVKEMIKKKEKKYGPLTPEVRQSMMDLSFYRFRVRFEHYLEKNIEKNCHVKIVSEAYTSKPCGNCGFIKYDLKGQEVYVCDRCSIKLDRDVNGGRNIILKTITPYLTK